MKIRLHPVPNQLPRAEGPLSVTAKTLELAVDPFRGNKVIDVVTDTGRRITIALTEEQYFRLSSARHGGESESNSSNKSAPSDGNH